MQTIFPLEINKGYFSGAYIVETVNGIKIKNFKHFVEVIDSLDTEFAVIDFIESTKVILDVKEAKESFKSIQNRYYIVKDRRVE